MTIIQLKTSVDHFLAAKADMSATLAPQQAMPLGLPSLIEDEIPKCKVTSLLRTCSYSGRSNRMFGRASGTNSYRKGVAIAEAAPHLSNRTLSSLHKRRLCTSRLCPGSHHWHTLQRSYYQQYSLDYDTEH